MEQLWALVAYKTKGEETEGAVIFEIIRFTIIFTTPPFSMISGALNPKPCLMGHYFASIANAMMPDTSGAAADVPVCWSVHPLFTSVVSYTAANKTKQFVRRVKRNVYSFGPLAF